MSDRDRVEFWAAVRTINQMKESLSPLILIQSDGYKKPFFIVGAGSPGDLLVVTMWKPYLETERPFYLLKPQKPYNRIQDIASDFIKAIQNIQGEGPYLLVGQCEGGSLAFEIAQQLQSKGQKVFLIFLDTPAPPYNDVLSLNFLIDRFRRSRKIIKFVTFTLNKISSFNLGTQLLYLIDKIKTKLWFYLYSKDKNLRQTKLIRNSCRLAGTRYRPTIYPERIIFLVREKRYNAKKATIQSWASMAIGGSEIYLIPSNKERHQSTAETLKIVIKSIGQPPQGKLPTVPL